MSVTIKRAIDILTPGKVRFSPPEHDEALELAREALRICGAGNMGAQLARKGEETNDKAI